MNCQCHYSFRHTACGNLSFYFSSFFGDKSHRLNFVCRDKLKTICSVFFAKNYGKLVIYEIYCPGNLSKVQQNPRNNEKIYGMYELTVVYSISRMIRNANYVPEISIYGYIHKWTKMSVHSNLKANIYICILDMGPFKVWDKWVLFEDVYIEKSEVINFHTQEVHSNSIYMNISFYNVNLLTVVACGFFYVTRLNCWRTCLFNAL